MFADKVILVVDDEADLRDILVDEIQVGASARTLVAKNGNEAWALLQNEKVDLVLSDVRMPGGDGVELAHRIKAAHPSQPPIVLISGFSDFDRRNAFDLGVEGYLAKPFHLDDVMRKVEFLLKPLAERLAKWPEGIQAKSAVAIADQELNLAKDCFGRGGFCYHSDVNRFRPGEWVEFSWKGFKGLGLIQWSIHSAEKNESCTGFEIWHLSSGLQEFVKFVEEHKPTSYIPK